MTANQSYGLSNHIRAGFVQSSLEFKTACQELWDGRWNLQHNEIQDPRSKILVFYIGKHRCASEFRRVQTTILLSTLCSTRSNKHVSLLIKMMPPWLFKRSLKSCLNSPYRVSFFGMCQSLLALGGPGTINFQMLRTNVSSTSTGSMDSKSSNTTAFM